MTEGNQAEELAARAAEAVRRTISDAEARAAEIVRDADAEASRIRDGAEDEASQIRERAEGDARERIESAQRALDELRGQLEQRVSGSGPAAEPPSAPGAETPVEPAPEPEPETESPGAPEAPVSPPPEPQPPAEPPPQKGEGANGDDAAARLVAMKLAVDGKGREEIEAELVERFGAGDRSALLDDVLARAGR